MVKRATRRSGRKVASSVKKSTKTKALIDNSAQDGSLDMLNIALDEVKLQVDNSCKQLVMRAHSLATTLDNQLFLALCNLTKADKARTIAEVLERSNAPVAKASRSSVMSRAAGAKKQPPGTVRRAKTKAVDPPAVPNTTRRSKRQRTAVESTPSRRSARIRSTATPMRTPANNRSRAVMQTPRQQGITAATPATRKVRRGEAVVSLNGSPLGAMGASMVASAVETPAINIELSDGNVLSSFQNTSDLDASSKAEALEKLSFLQQELARLKESIQEGIAE